MIFVFSNAHIHKKHTFSRYELTEQSPAHICDRNLIPRQSAQASLLFTVNFPNKRPGRLLTQHPRQGGAYLGQMTFLLYKNAKMAQKWGRLFGQGRLFGRGRLHS